MQTLDKHSWLAHDILEAIPAAIAIKNPSLDYVYCNIGFATLTGLDNTKDILKINDDSQFPGSPHDAQTVATFHEENMLSLQRRTLNIIDFHIYSGTAQLYLTQKKPITDHEGSIAGMLIHSTSTSFTTEQLCDYLNNRNYQMSKSVEKNIRNYLNTQTNTVFLARRYTQCLYYLLQGMTAQRIADHLKLSRRTIESYINEIIYKLFCRDRTDVIIKAARSNFMSLAEKDLENGCYIAL